MSFDNVCKLLAEKYPADFAQWLIASASTNIKVLKTELSLEPIRADSVTFIQTANIILHLEFQTLTQSNPGIPLRMLDYSVRLKFLKFTEVAKILRQSIPGIILYIRQTWTRINVRLVTQNSSSYFIMASVNTHDSSEPSLKYEYMNEPSVLSVNTMNAHRGTANLKLSPDGKELAGDYFTGRGRQNLGTMEFKFISREYLTREEALRRAASSSTQQP